MPQVKKPNSSLNEPSFRLEASRKKALLLPSYSTKINFELKRDARQPIPVKAFFQDFIRRTPKLFAELKLAQKSNERGEVVYEIENIRGRSPERLPASISTELGARSQEELFFSKGYAQEKEGDQQEEEKLEVETLGLYSKFLAFTPQKKVLHHLSIAQSSDSPATFPLEAFADYLPNDIEQLRFGFEQFGQSEVAFFRNILPPKVRSRFYIELSPTKLSLEIEVESASPKKETQGKILSSCFSKFDSDVLNALSEALHEADLVIDLKAEIASKLSAL